MSVILHLPRLGETMEEGRIAAWLIDPGATYHRGDAILEVETDKTVVEVPALEDGELLEILAPEGAQVRVGAPVARISGDPSTQVLATPEDTSEKDQAAALTAVSENLAPAAQGVRATPLARRLARQNNLGLDSVKGTGRRGRIERIDVLRHLGGRAQPSDATANLAFEAYGPEGGPPVVLLHGFGGDHSVWSALANNLARAGHHVLAPDLAGHGATPIEAHELADLSKGLSDLVAQQIGGTAHIVAHSMGAIPAVTMAEAGLARSLSLIAPAGVGLKIDGDFVHGLAAARTGGEVAHLLQRMTETPLPLSQPALEHIAQSLGKGRLSALATALVGAAGQTVSLRARLAKLSETLTVRIIAAHRDRILDWSDMVTLSPRIAVHHLPQAGHMAAWDAPSEVLDILCSGMKD